MTAAAKSEMPDALNRVTITTGFLGRIVKRTVWATLPHVLGMCEEEGHMCNLEIAAGRSNGEYTGGPDRDSNLFKVMEGAAYGLVLSGDETLAARLEDLIELIAAAQQPDGYLQSYISSQTPQARYADLPRSHELYCAGHLLEAAVAHFEATGKSALLDVAIRLADHVDETFGPGRMETAPGHQEIEMALVRLYRVTGEKRYLALSRYFVERRGSPERVAREYGGKPVIEDDRTPGRNRPPEYRQDHLPMLEQTFATGHAVRAGYLYAALADIAIEYDSGLHAEAASAIWENIVHRKLYLSGGVGTHQYHDEGYGDDYVLPNTGYCETCGGIAFMLFSHRMGLLTGDARYTDVVELILYNHMLSSTDLSGCNTFYQNPLSCRAPRERHPWHYPACCPTNMVRMVPQLARYVYALGEGRIFVDQFTASEAALELEGQMLRITQETNYPWDGGVDIIVKPAVAQPIALHVRLPGWLTGSPVPSDLYRGSGNDGVTITVNGRAFEAPVQKGYAVIARVWQPGDRVRLDLPMPVQRVRAHPNVEANTGRVAIMRGPLLYCFEETDGDGDPEDIRLPADTELVARHEPDMLGGITLITDQTGCLTAVPFNAWNNRKPGRMAVWVNEGSK